jgi:hypothetical protein
LIDEFTGGVFGPKAGRTVMGASTITVTSEVVREGTEDYGLLQTTAAKVAPSGTRCWALLKNGERCKHEGQPTLDGHSDRYLYYCIAHRRLLREKGLLPSVEGQSATNRMIRAVYASPRIRYTPV